MNDYESTRDADNQEVSRENNDAVRDRESAEERDSTSSDGDDAKEIGLAISLAISQASPVLTIKELALEITKGLWDWVGTQEDKLLELSKELAWHANVPTNK